MITSMFKSIKILDKKIHKDIKVSPIKDFKPAAGMHFVHISRDEAMEACKHYPLFFAKDDKTQSVALIALLGIKEKQNVFVDSEGKWEEGRFIPLAIRSYPFFITKMEDRYPIVFDEAYEGINQEDGQKVFGDDGELNEYGKKILEFIEKAFFSIENTAPVLKQIDDLDLFKEVGANLEKNGEKYNIRGIWQIDPKKVDTLPDDKIIALAKTGALALIHVHLLALTNIQNVLAKV